MKDEELRKLQLNLNKIITDPAYELKIRRGALQLYTDIHFYQTRSIMDIYMAEYKEDEKDV